MYLNGRISRIQSHWYLCDWLIFFKDTLEFDFANNPLQMLKISEKNTNFDIPLFEFNLSSPCI